MNSRKSKPYRCTGGTRRDILVALPASFHFNQGVSDMKKNIVLASTALLATALLADATMGNGTLNAQGSKRRMTATVSATTAVVAAPVVEKKIEATNTWVVSAEDTVVTNVVKVAEEPIRPYIPVIAALTSLDCNGNGIPDSTEIANGATDADNDGILDSCEYALGDLNLNGVVDGQDVSILLGWWAIPNPLFGDLNGDNMVDAFDLGILLGRFGVVTY